MWDELSRKDRDEYKRMMLAFASLTEMFAQKTEDSEDIPAPIINSKYQETVFQKAFHASAEDIEIHHMMFRFVKNVQIIS